MATELPKERSDEATVTSANDPTISINSDNQNVDLHPPHVNGDSASAGTEEIENKHISDIVDDLVNSSEVSISGGSDNEASKTGALKGNDDKGHGRTSSTVKKPSSFKPIQVNQKFLTTKSPALAPPSKPSDKAASATASVAAGGAASAPRPRLVAKSGSGLASKSLTGANSGKAGGAPDPNAVWNKNRPPEPKKYTDEELKKYGIHMASRLQADDAKGQANWADIDDDDEDWAPETITWKDGTKIAIPHTEEAPPAPEPLAPAPAPTAPPKAAAPKENGVVEKPKSPAPISLAGRPGVSVLTKGLVLKGAAEKPTLVAKPPAPPTPVKSPWAPIPKVDKVSPIVMDIPSQQHGSRLGPRDGISKSISPPPPKEFAADDFSRAGWRDGSSGGNRELFNSQSGRYEPVQDRRGSMRQDGQHGRQPAVLQRASIHEQQGPAEPSAAFQTSRTSDQHVPYGRRRGSSVVSGGSGGFGNRLKGYDQHLPPPEVLNARRESFTAASDSPVSPMNQSPSGQHGGPRTGPGWPPRASPSTTHASPYLQHAQPVSVIPPAQPPVPSVTEEDYELQKRLMRERLELAKQRRLEEEAKEEAARKERIRMKLEALGPAPESKSAKKAKDSTTPTQIQPRDVTQQAEEPKSAERERPVLNLAPPSVPKPSEHAVPNGIPAQTLPSSDAVESHASHGATHAHPWPNTAKQPEPRYTAATWGAQASKNVWGAPNNNRTLGNGTFVSDLGTTQLPQIASKSGPGPIAPPSGGLPRHPPIGPPKTVEKPAGSALSATEREARQGAWADAVRLNDDAFLAILKAQDNERDRRLQKEGRGVVDIQPVIKDNWRPTKLNDNGHRDEAIHKQSLLVGAENPWANTPEIKGSSSQHAPSIPSAPPSEFGQRSQNITASRETGPAHAPQPVRGSRFFPSRDTRHEPVAPIEVQRPKSPSPPPPDMAGHPAFDGDASHPHVALPPPQPRVRLPPAVVTEPRATVPLHAPTGPSNKTPTFTWANTVAYKEPETGHIPQGPASNPPRSAGQKPGSVWQAKIDDLLGGRKAHPTSKQPAGVDSMSRSAFDHGDHATTVSFLGFSSRWAAKETSMSTKDMAEECFEEQEMGSLPPVRVPHDASEVVKWGPSPLPPKPLPKKFAVTVSSAEAITFPPDVGSHGYAWKISLPGHEVKVLNVPFGRTRSNPRRGGGDRRGGSNRHPSSTHPRSGKGREPSSSYSTDHGSSASSSNHIPQARNSRGGYRGRDSRDTWTRNAAPIQT
ncbi:hypothetical protein V8F33_009285 [Rhypophila sp. PSN 637]